MVGRPEAVEHVRAETEAAGWRRSGGGRGAGDRPRSTSRPFAEFVREHSRDADLTVLGMQRPDAAGAPDYGEDLDALVQAAGTTLLVHNGAPSEASLGG